MTGVRSFLALAAGALFVVPSGVRAQSGVVEGTAVTSGTQRPLPGVQITVVGIAGKGASSDASGRFRITGLPEGTVVLNARLIGYRPHIDTVRVGTTNVRLSLSERGMELDPAVVAGKAG